MGGKIAHSGHRNGPGWMLVRRRETRAGRASQNWRDAERNDEGLLRDALMLSRLSISYNDSKEIFGALRREWQCRGSCDNSKLQ